MRNLTRLLVLGALVISAEARSSWKYSVSNDEFSDKSIHMASVLTAKDVFGLVRCNVQKELEVFFSVGSYIGSGDEYKVRYRIDKDSAVSGKWSVSSEGTAVFLDKDAGKELSRGLMKGNKFLLEATDYRGTSHRSTFPLKGSNRAIGKVLKACGIAPIRVRNELSWVVKDTVARFGPRYTVCNKNMLRVIGYEIKDKTANKSEDMVLAMQDFYNKEGDHSRGIFPFMKLYSEAKSANYQLIRPCGDVYLED